MRLSLLLFTLLTTWVCYAQMQPIGKVYIVEGMVVDRETFQVLPSTILYNDSLGIATTTDENGYFKIVVPHALIEKGQPIYFDLSKTGYKRYGWGFDYNPETVDSTKCRVNEDTMFVWHYGVNFIWLTKVASPVSTASSATMPAKAGLHGYPGIKLTYDNEVAEEVRDRKFAQLKQGNEKVYFPLDSVICLATRRTNIIVVGKLTHVFIDDKKIKLSEINKVVKRSEIVYDVKKSDSLTTKYAKKTLAFTTISNPSATPDKPWSATLVINVGN